MLPALKKHVYQLLASDKKTRGLSLLGQAVAENLDEEGLLLLVELNVDQRDRILGLRAIENVVTSREPSPDWQGAFEIVSTAATAVRRRLLALAADGSKEDFAARCLIAIAELRDEYGAPESEPRHPDLASGKAWPIII